MRVVAECGEITDGIMGNGIRILPDKKTNKMNLIDKLYQMCLIRLTFTVHCCYGNEVVLPKRRFEKWRPIKVNEADVANAIQRIGILQSVQIDKISEG